MLVTDFVELLLRFECRAPLSLAWTSWLERAGEPTAQSRVPGVFTLMKACCSQGTMYALLAHRPRSQL